MASSAGVTSSAAVASSAASATSAAAGASAPAGASSASETDAAARAARAKAAKNFVKSDKWVEGKNYFLIQPQQPKVTNTDKVEVVEVFSFGCPSCNAAHKIIDKLEASLPPYATMAFLPAGFRPDENWPLYQRAWYAAKALGVAHKSYDAMFDATWKTGETATYDLSTGKPKPKSQWPTIDDIAKFYSGFGVSAKEFKAVADSFTVDTKVKRADELVKDYGVQGTPSIVIDGKYRFDFRSAGGTPQLIELTHYLVAKEAAGK
jgi:thiol:disulfide interchange protein DsbA